MPKEFPPFTNEEKAKIIANHKAIVDRLNNSLDEKSKLQYDPELEKKLNDPKVVKIYRMTTELIEIQRKQEEIRDKFYEKYGVPDPENPGRFLPPNLKPDPLKRNIHYEFKTDGSKESEEFNERLFVNYMKNPMKEYYRRTKNVITFDPTEFEKLGQDPEKQVEFFYDNRTICLDSFVIKSSADFAGHNITKEFENFATGAKGLIEDLVAGESYVLGKGGDNLFLPKLNEEQAAQIMANDRAVMDRNAKGEDFRLQKLIIETLDNTTAPSGYDNIKKVDEALNLSDTNEFYLKYKAEWDHDGKVEEVSLKDAVLDNKVKDQYKIRERTDEEKFHIMNITKDFEKEYLKKMNVKLMNSYDKGKQFNFNDIKNKNKGGFFERLIGTTSNEYKEMRDALEEFNNPDSKNFMNREYLNQKAQAYIDRKDNQGKSFEQMDSTSKGRYKLAKSIQEMIGYSKEHDDKIRGEVEHEMFPDGELENDMYSEKEQFLNENDLDDSMENEMDSVDLNTAVIHENKRDKHHSNEVDNEKIVVNNDPEDFISND